jgi:hypothetical protein
MMAGLDDTRGQVEEDNVSVRRSITKKDACKVMMNKFAATGTSHLDTDMRAKGLEVPYIRASSGPILLGGFVGSRVYEMVVSIHRVEKCLQPEFYREPGAVEEGSYLYGEGVVINLSTAILGRAV